MFTPDDLVLSYTRVDALRNGVLIDVSERAQEAGFRIPVAVTAATWADVVEWPDTEPAIQDESGRLCNLVFMAAVAARARRREGDRATFALLVVPRGKQVPRLTDLVLHIGPGGQGEPVATIMEPGED